MAGPSDSDSGDDLFALLSDISNHLRTPAAESLDALSDLHASDLDGAAVQASATNLTYQAALETIANIGQLSLLDFLR
jgi:hypothetical protein